MEARSGVRSALGEAAASFRRALSIWNEADRGGSIDFDARGIAQGWLARAWGIARGNPRLGADSLRRCSSAPGDLAMRRCVCTEDAGSPKLPLVRPSLRRIQYLEACPDSPC